MPAQAGPAERQPQADGAHPTEEHMADVATPGAAGEQPEQAQAAAPAQPAAASGIEEVLKKLPRCGPPAHAYIT